MPKCDHRSTQYVSLLIKYPSGTSFIGDVVTMEEVLNCSNKILSSVMMMPLSGSNKMGWIKMVVCIIIWV